MNLGGGASADLGFADVLAGMAQDLTSLQTGIGGEVSLFGTPEGGTEDTIGGINMLQGSVAE